MAHGPTSAISLWLYQSTITMTDNKAPLVWQTTRPFWYDKTGVLLVCKALKIVTARLLVCQTSAFWCDTNSQVISDLNIETLNTPRSVFLFIRTGDCSIGYHSKMGSQHSIVVIVTDVPICYHWLLLLWLLNTHISVFLSIGTGDCSIGYHSQMGSQHSIVAIVTDVPVCYHWLLLFWLSWRPSWQGALGNTRQSYALTIQLCHGKKWWIKKRKKKCCAIIL